VRACLGADVMMGHDPHCERWIARFREASPPGADGEAIRGRRERGRRPTAA
jgi:5-methyltetrahydrofolate--homocysteine methyltransferase